MDALLTFVFFSLGFACLFFFISLLRGVKYFEKRYLNIISAIALLLVAIGDFGLAIHHCSRIETRGEVRTKVSPQIDTLVSVKGNVKDTTYVYHF